MRLFVGKNSSLIGSYSECITFDLASQNPESFQNLGDTLTNILGLPI